MTPSSTSPTGGAAHELELVAQVPGVDGDSYQGLVRELRDAVVTVDFAADRSPRLAVTSRVPLHFVGSLVRPITASGKVAGCAEDTVRRTYDFELDAAAGGALALHFNRRRPSRVPADPEQPVEVTVRGESGVEASGRLVDLSEHGMCVRLDRDDEPLLGDAWHVRTSFALPGDPSPIRLSGLVRHRSRVGAHVHYGLLFDPFETDGFAREQARVTRYMETLQRAMLQRSR